MRRAPAAVPLALLLVAGCSSGTPSTHPSTAPSGSSAPSGSAGPSPSGSTRPLRTGPPRLELVGRFASPLYVTAPAGDPRLFVVEQGGRVRVVRDGRTLPAPFLDVTRAITSGGEQGLLSIAFAPDYATTGRFYVDYTDTRGDTRVVEYRVSGDPDRADAGSARELLHVDQPADNHNGGLLLFDRAGMLLVGLGDGGGAGDADNHAQNTHDLLGKILRIDPHPAGGRAYGIPADNPYADGAAARPEVWAYGLRNPWRFSIDPETGDLYVGDVGQGDWEEVDAVPPDRQPGANYGWRVYEGRSRYTDGIPAGPGRLVAPVHVYGHGGGGCSVTGGVVYRGSVAALRGRYLFGDYCTGDVWSFPAGTAADPKVAAVPVRGGQLTSFGVDAAGEVYLCSAGGEVWRITA